MPLVDPISSLTSSLSEASLIPSIIPESFSPSALIRIVWPSGAEVLIGNTIDATAMTEEPGIEVLPNNLPALEASTTDDNEGKETTYTLAMFDPDAPSRDDPKYGCFRHWVITGLKAPGSVTSQTAPQFALASQPAVTPYRAPAPGPGTGDHRYVFLLYEEPRAGVSVALDAPERGNEKEERRSWNPTQFAEQHNLRLVAANFFVCHVDV